jgi:hypothetical protein
VKQRANGGMRKLVAVDQLLVRRPLSLKLFQRGCIDDGAAWLKLMDEDIDQALPPLPAAQLGLKPDFYSNTSDAPRT